MKQTDITLEEGITLYVEHLEEQGRHERTLYTYRKDLEQVLVFFGPGKLLRSILVAQVGKFYRSDALLKLPDGKDRAERTLAKTLRVFRMFMVWAYTQGYITQLPLPKATSLGRSVPSLL